MKRKLVNLLIDMLLEVFVFCLSPEGRQSRHPCNQFSRACWSPRPRRPHRDASDTARRHARHSPGVSLAPKLFERCSGRPLVLPRPAISGPRCVWTKYIPLANRI